MASGPNNLTLLPDVSRNITASNCQDPQSFCSFAEKKRVHTVLWYNLIFCRVSVFALGNVSSIAAHDYCDRAEGTVVTILSVEALHI